MEAAFNHKSLDRVVSQRAYQMSISFPCQICVVGFFCGICLTTLFMAALTSFGGISNSNISSSLLINAADGECNNKLVKQEEKVMYYPSEGSEVLAMDEKVTTLYSLWSDLFSKSTSETSLFSKKIQLSKSINVPKAPHLEDCKASVGLNLRLDQRIHNESFPPWTIWKGTLDELSPSTDDEQLRRYRNRMISEGAYPPWVEGSDEDNYPLTRKVQRDIWLHQHPSDCRDSNVKFLVADWERLPGFGIGAQIAGMSGLLSIAIKEGRVLVTNYFNRADHDGCQGTSRSSWSCYFFPETSQECRERAFELIRDRAALEKGVITVKANYTSKEIWSGPTPRVWGSPWSIMQPTTEINGSLLIRHRKMDRRWWRAQAVRYLMRFQSEYTCNLMNIARHDAFGREAARMVLESSAQDPLTRDVKQEMSDIERYAWSNSKPWIPRPLLSMHVRMGDKACEMKVVWFQEYMNLGQVLRRRFPQLKHVWLSTEMQDVIDRSKSYRNWRFYYTNVTRQTGNSTMATYEANLGRETSTNYPMVNFLMASDADFFVGALGSTWCFLIDGMRNTGGKVMSGYLSVNKDRFW